MDRVLKTALAICLLAVLAVGCRTTEEVTIKKTETKTTTIELE